MDQIQSRCWLFIAIFLAACSGADSSDPITQDTAIDSVADSGQPLDGVLDLVQDEYSSAADSPDVAISPDSLISPETVPTCGNDVCDKNEDCSSCPSDCAPCTECGDGVCEPGSPPETAEGCPEDCGPCGDGVCGLQEESPPYYCALDCATVCGDGECQSDENDNEGEAGYCPPDCGGCGDGCCGYKDLFDPQLIDCQSWDCQPGCGDGVCDPGEEWPVCPVDCGWCGDGVCGQVWGQEEPCPQDCIVPCGDGECSGNETAESCASDCGWCGDGVCSYREMDLGYCYGDCPPPCGDGVCVGDETAQSCPYDCGCQPLCESQWECGPDGAACQQQCGACPTAAVCLEHTCCVPDSCKDKQCGADGCGGSCGDCEAGTECIDWYCQDPDCVPDCQDNQCGSNGCGGVCGWCDDGLFCTADSCFQNACLNETVPLYCVVEQQCFYSGQPNPEQPCQRCKPLSAQDQWSNAEDGYPCEDAAVCIAGECCHKAEACQGKQCGPDGCGGHCGFCAPDEGCQDGICVSGVECTPDCGDNQCGDDGCGGNCGQCDDGLDCTNDICVFGQCKALALPLFCLIENACYASGQSNPADPCQRCSPFQGSYSWSTAASGMSCKPEGCNLPGICVGGVCQGSFPLDCDDQVACTLDSCEGAQCVNTPVDAVCAVDEPCIEGVCDPEQGCTEVNIEGPCDDMDPCTTDDSCQDGDCQAGPPLVCDDLNSCTTDSCEPLVGCQYAVLPNGTSCGAGMSCQAGVCGLLPECVDGNHVDWDGCNSGVISEFQINSTTAANQRFPAVAALPDGAFAVVWHDTGDADSSKSGVFWQRFDSLGLPDGGEELVNVTTSNQQQHPDIATLSDGRVLITWEGYGDVPGAGFAAYARFFLADGTPDSGEILLSLATSGFEKRPSLAGLANGDFVAAWRGFKPDNTEIGVGGFDLAGEAIYGPAQANVYEGGVEFAPAIASFLDGQWLVVWTSQDTVDHIDDLYGRRYDIDGTPLGAEFQVGANPDDYENQAAVATFGQAVSNRFVVVWSDNVSDGTSSNIRAQVYEQDGSLLGVEIPVTGSLTGPQSRAAVCGHKDGFVVTWSDQAAGGHNGVLFRRYDTEGIALGDGMPVNIFQPDTPPYPNDVACYGNGGFVTVWEVSGLDSEGYGIFGRRFDSEGGPCALESCAAGGSQLCPPGACDDLLDCTVDQCNVFTGECTHLPDDGQCEDGEPCTLDTCVPGQGCQQSILSGSCDDGDLCTLDDHCEAGVCTGDVNPCHGVDMCAIDNCQPGVGCQHLSGALYDACEDDDPCTVKNHCASNGGCVFDPAANGTVCDGGQCLDGYCDDGQDDCTDGTVDPWDGCEDETIVEVVVNSTQANDQVEPDIASLENGGYVVVWASKSQDGAKYGVYGRRFAADGTAEDGEFAVMSESGDTDRRPAVAGIPGGFVVLWDSDVALFNDDILGQKYDLNGNPVGEPAFTANDHTDDDQSTPELTSLSNGFVAVWESMDQQAIGSLKDVVVRRFDAAGTPAGPGQIISQTTVGNQRFPAIAAFDDDSFVATWSSYGQDQAGNYGVYARLYDQDGQPLTDEFPVNEYTSGGQNYSEVVSFPSGEFLVAWDSMNQEGLFAESYARWYDEDGSPVTGEFRLNHYGFSNQKGPALAALGDGPFVAVWDGEGKYSQRSAQVRLYDRFGKPGKFEVSAGTVDLPTGSDLWPEVAVLNDGSFVVVWEAPGQDLDGEGIFTQRFSQQGQKQLNSF